MKKLFVLAFVLVVSIAPAVSQLCNAGFENHKQGSSFPNDIAQVDLSECWKERQSGFFNSPDWFVHGSFHLEEDIDGDGLYSDILGNNNSNGYIG